MTPIEFQKVSSDIAGWLNANQGVVSVALFILTIIIAWASGILTSLRRKAKFTIELIPGPTFCCTFLTGRKFGEFDEHMTAIALYLKIANVGSASANIENIAIAYHWHVRPFHWVWLRYRIFWFWLHQQTVALSDFQVEIGDSIKFYPSLLQPSILLGAKPETFLEVGQSVNGVVYFEQRESWGGCFPSPRNGLTRIKVAVTDTFGKRHTHKFWVPVVGLEEARKYNPSFADTYAALRRGPTPTDRNDTNELNPGHTSI